MPFGRSGSFLDLSSTLLELIELFSKSLGCRTTYHNSDVVNNSEIVILAIKPPVVPKVLNDIKSSVSSKQLMISIALGIPIECIEKVRIIFKICFFLNFHKLFQLKVLPENSRIIRVMSNTPVLIRQGASVFSCGTNATKEDSMTVRKLFTSVGICEEVPESLIDAVTALSGSGPAYVSS